MNKEMSKEISKQLANCPFCGGEARLQKKNRKRGWYVICKNTNCGCRTPFYQHQYTSEDDLQTIATMVWNTRKPMKRIVERLEAMQDNLPAELSHCHEFYVEGMFEGLNRGIEIVKEEGGMNEMGL